MKSINNLIQGNIYNKINILANLKETFLKKKDILNMRNLDHYNRVNIASKYIYNEMPIRFSKRIKELEKFPFDINQHSEINKIRNWYCKSLEDILSLPYPKNNYNDIYNCVTEIVSRHSYTLNTVAKGIYEMKKVNENIYNDYYLNNFLNDFYKNRTRTRTLLLNYLGYHKHNDNLIGNIKINCNIKELIQNSIHDLEDISYQNKLNIPEIELNIEPTSFSYIDDYLYYSILEILKNSVKAINDKNINGKINITSYNDNNIYILKISDNGIGIQNNILDKIWNFGYTTTDLDINNYNKEKVIINPISGFGYGLPLSKIYLKLFQGNIHLFSEYNIGTDVYIFIDLKNDWYL